METLTDIREHGVPAGETPADIAKDQAALLANLALANQIFNQNIDQQNQIASQQALFQLQLAAVSKCVELITAIDPASPDAAAQLHSLKEVMAMIVDLFGHMTSKEVGVPATH